MDLNFYSDLTDGTGPHGDPEFLDPGSFNGYDNKFPEGNNNYLTISGAGHPFLSSSETFHTPSLGDEEFEIPPISLDPDQALIVSDVVAHFGALSDGERSGLSTPGNVVVGGDDPSFASTFVNPHPGSQGLDHHLSLGVISQPGGGGAILGSALSMDLGHPVGSQFSSSSPMTIDVPLSDMDHSLLGHNQLITIDQSELSAQLGLSLGGGANLARSQSPDQPLSAAASPAGSLQDDDMDDFRQSVLVESPISLGVISLEPPLSDSPIPSFAPSSSTPPTLVRRRAAAGGGKKGKKKKDPNEPQKPVSAYALFFRDTQAAIKGQNPSATFGEVSKIVASMWDSLGEEQKQVYKRKTEAAKKEYLEALEAYRDHQLSQPTIEVLDTSPSPPSSPPVAPLPAPAPRSTRSSVPHLAPEENTITNICTSNIILAGGDLPQVTTRSRTGVQKPPTPTPALALNPPTVTKIIIKQQTSPSGVMVVSSSTVLSTRQPPPLQQMQNTPPPPRLQQMVHAQAPPPLQAKPRGGGAMAPPPLQIKIVPPASDLDSPVIGTAAGGLAALGGATPTSGEVVQSAALVTACSTEAEDGAEGEDGMQVELNVSPGPDVTQACSPNLCVRAGCTNPAVENKDWDREYCSNKCVATHCRDVFMAWCAIRGQDSTVT
ncbi:TOX high mobility group box family member 4 isoform X1 [Oncorhynchus mykiss]|uniref:TOX high mobility group box family member 4 b n=1 Tax=Oncorhynchus mykiss TaxID=8022 RepID=A0A8C7QI47_ONCMY|nr:TOX high mobility group box family member 4 isoform X1 [Oncorhynchus mykiss]